MEHSMQIELITKGGVGGLTSSRGTIRGLDYRLAQLPPMVYTNHVETWPWRYIGYKRALLYFRIDNRIGAKLFMKTLNP